MKEVGPPSFLRIMIVDGRKIAEEMKEALKKEVALLGHTPMKEVQPRSLGGVSVFTPVLAIVMVGNDLASKQFVGIKKRFAEAIGVPVQIVRFPEDTGTNTLVDVIEKLNAEISVGGIVVQLPLPRRVDTQAVLDAVSVEKDIDVLSILAIERFGGNEMWILPPVVGAFAEILKRENVDIKGKNAVVVGRGALVGRPAETWLAREGANVHVLDKSVDDISMFTREADILVLGAGSPGLITPDIIKEGVVLLDAGTSEAAGKLVGDADPVCAKKCCVFTPVPGGVGPVTVAMIFKNLLELKKLST